MRHRLARADGSFGTSSYSLPVTAVIRSEALHMGGVFLCSRRLFGLVCAEARAPNSGSPGLFEHMGHLAVQ